MTAFLTAARQEGAAAFERLGGLPTTHQEAWRWTNVAPIGRIPFDPPAPSDAKVDLSALRMGAARLVFVDGRFAPDQSSMDGLPAGVRLRSLGEADPAVVEAMLGQLAKAAEHPFTALNAAHLSDGAVLEIDAGVQAPSPIELVFASRAGAPASTHPRVLVRLGAGARAQVAEIYAGLSPGPYFTNAVTEVSLGEGAELEHARIQVEGGGGYHVGSLWVAQARASRLRSHVFSLGALLARSDVSSRFDGEGGQCELHGLYVGQGSQHLDHHTSLDHKSPGCTSREVYKGILDGRSRGVFTGAVRVREGAQKTDAAQSNKALLLSEDASAEATPQLQIFADDVKCAHGAAVGQLDDQALFYLRSRGIPLDRARALLTRAFAEEVVQGLSVQAWQQRIELLLSLKLGGEVRA
ncbi:MAG TPA: Fe-S cluster assembly protein SufD [Myxococcaceae bacterium]|jgi:Fe-S cluster assembly protein SufD